MIQIGKKIWSYLEICRKSWKIKNIQLICLFFKFFTGQIVRQVNQPCHTLLRSATRIKRPIIQNWQKQLKFKQLKICVNNIHTTVNRGSKNRLEEEENKHKKDPKNNKKRHFFGETERLPFIQKNGLENFKKRIRELEAVDFFWKSIFSMKTVS